MKYQVSCALLKSKDLPSLANTGCLSRIYFFPSRIQGQKDFGTGSESLVRIVIFYPSGSRGQKGIGTRIRIRNTNKILLPGNYDTYFAWIKNLNQNKSCIRYRYHLGIGLNKSISNEETFFLKSVKRLGENSEQVRYPPSLNTSNILSVVGKCRHC
jgi:hypothetical protein